MNCAEFFFFSKFRITMASVNSNNDSAFDTFIDKLVYGSELE